MGKLLAFLAGIFGYLLNFIYIHVNNYGLAIILFTIAVQIILLPFFIKQQKTLIKNSRIQAKLAELRDKYKNDQVRLGQETMDLYKREKMSPFSGCLGSILQIIIFISIFYLVRQPLTYMEKRSPEEINSYRESYQISDNSAYKEIDIIREANARGDEININMMFLGVDLSNIPTRNWTNWTVYIIPGLYVISSIVSMKITQAQAGLNKKKKLNEEKDVIEIKESKDEKIIKDEIIEDEKEEIIEENKDEKALVKVKNKKKKEEEDEEDMAEAMNKQMSIMMPVMAVSIALVAPLGLALYWLVNNIIQTVQRIILNKIYKKEEE